MTTDNSNNSQGDLIERTQRVIERKAQADAEQKQRRRRARMAEYVNLLLRWKQPADGDEAKLAELMEELGFDVEQVKKHADAVKWLGETHDLLAEADQIHAEFNEAKQEVEAFEKRIESERAELERRRLRAYNRVEHMSRRGSELRIVQNDVSELFEEGPDGRKHLIGQGPAEQASRA